MESIERPNRFRNLLLIGIAVAMVVIAAVAYYTYRAYQAAATDLVLQRDSQVAQLSASRLTSELTNFSGLLEDLARTNAMFNGIHSQQLEVLHQAAPRLAVFDGGTLLLDSRGQVIGSEPERSDLQGVDLSKREYFRSLLGQSNQFTSDTVADGPEGEPVIALAVPIQGPEGEFVGGLVGFFRIGEDISSAFYASLVRLRLGQTGSTYLFDGQARILFDTSQDRVGHFLTTRDLTGISVLRQQGTRRTTDEAGREIVSALASVPGTDWTLIIEDDWSEITRSTRRYANIFFLSLAMGLILPPIGLTLLARQRRFQQLLTQNITEADSAAKLVRQSIQPRNLPMLPGWELAVRTSHQAPGQTDYYDAEILSDGRLMLAYGSSQGPALDSALALMRTHTILQTAAEQASDPKQAMDQCNRLLASANGRTKISSFFMVLDPINGDFRYCSAGQSTPIIVDQLTAGEAWHADASKRLGDSLFAEFDGGSGRLQPGQVMLLANRQALEARGLDGEVFVDEVFLDILSHPPDSLDRLANQLMAEYRAFASTLPGSPPSLTLILLDRLESENGAKEGIG